MAIVPQAPTEPIGGNRLFEYCAAVITLDIPTLTAAPAGMPTAVPAMNDLGAYGWELYAMDPIPARQGQFVGFFRRDLIPGAPGGPTTTAVVAELVPNTAQIGSPNFTLRVLGTGFTAESLIAANGTDVATTYVSSTELSHLVDMDTVVAAGTVDVTVRTGTLVSNVLVFTLTPAPATAPVLTSLVPDTVQLGQPSFTMRILGTGFTPESILVWNGSDDVCAFVSATELTTTINMATAGAAVTVGIEVRNGPLVSNTLPFTFTAAPTGPVLTSLDPSTAPVGPGFTIQVHGSGFTPNTELFVNGTMWPSVQTVYMNPTQLGLMTNAVSQPGTHTIQAAEGPTGARSNSLEFTYTA